MLQREVTHNRNTKQTQQKKTEDPAECEFDQVYDEIEVGRKMAAETRQEQRNETTR